MTIHDAAAILSATKQANCNHVPQDMTEIVPGVLHCWGCGKEWNK